jgi:hypothetical protein
VPAGFFQLQRIVIKTEFLAVEDPGLPGLKGAANLTAGSWIQGNHYGTVAESVVNASGG